MRRAERLFRIVSELRTRGVTRAADLAAHFEISVRSIYRDIAYLQGSGLPIDGEPGVGYMLRPGFDLPAMTFTFEQVDALALGLAFVETAGDAALAEAAGEVRAKLQAALPDPGDRRLVAAPLFAARRDGRAGAVASRIRHAIRASYLLEIHYRDDRGSRTRRRVRPLAIWAFTDGWLFVAWCELRDDFRAFRLDRIDALVETKIRFDDHPDRNPRTYLAAHMPEAIPPG